MTKYKYSLYNVVICNDRQDIVLFNCFSGAIIKLENSVFEKIKKGLFLLHDIQYCYELLDNGFIIPEKIDEFNRIKTLSESSLTISQKTITYVIAPTLNCNYNCRYCFQKGLRTSGNDNMITDAMFEKIKNFILSCNINIKTVNKIRINWFGGEPLLCYKQIVLFCQEIKKELASNNISFECSMITNGVLLNEEKLKELTSKCNLKQIQITIDGEEDTYCNKKQTMKNNFYKVIQNICIATKYVRTVVRLNADKENYAELLALSQRLIRMDINLSNLVIHFAQLRNYDNNSCDYPFFDDLEYLRYKKIFYNSLKNYKTESSSSKNCLMGFKSSFFCGLSRKNNFVIDYLGNLYKCEHYIGDKTKIVGDIENGIYYNEQFLNSLSFPQDSRCRICNIFPLCNYSRCTAMHKFTGDNTECLCYKRQVDVIKEKIKNIL